MLIIYLGKICITECISQSHWQKKGIHVHQHCVNNLSGKDLYHRVYFTESLAEKRDTCTVINNSKEKLTFRSRVVSCFVLVSDSVQLTYKKYLVLIICLGIICIKVYFTQSLEEKRDTCTSTTVKKNLHLEQEWCPDLYWSLVLCNSPIKNI